MKILLTTLNAKYIHTNLAIRLLYDLNKDYEGLSWKEFTINQDKDEVAAQCSEYDVLAFSCYIWNITQTLDVAKRIKALNPTTKIMLGGPEVSYDWQDIIALEQVDYIVTGEGENPFKAFLESYPNVLHLTNIVQKVEKDVIYFPKSETFDLKKYTKLMPYGNETPESLGTKVLYIETSRGCPYKCEFCLASLDNKVRYLPDEHIKATLLYMMHHGKVIKFLDRTFNIKRDFTIDIFKFILQHHRPENVFQFEITADILHADIIKYIDENVPKGLFRFEIGIQTVNQKANLEVSRKQNFDKTTGIIKALQHKVEMHLDLIVGLPFDYFEDIKYSFESVFKLFPPELQLGFLKFLKGTPMLYKHAQHGYVFDPNPPYQIIESSYLSRAELHLVELLEHGLEIYWNKNRTQHTLKYVTANYSIFDFLQGLGAYFGEQQAFHKYVLSDVYDNINNYVSIYYKEDIVLKELIAVDYYLFHKQKPKTMYLAELSQTDKYEFLAQQQADTQKYGYKVLPLSFDFDVFEKENIIVSQPYNLIVQYNGVDKPIVVPSVELV